MPLIGAHGLTPAHAFSCFCRNRAWLAHGGHGALAYVCFGSASRTSRYRSLAWIGFLISLVVLAGYANVHSARSALGDVHVDRSRRPDLVRLRLGNATPRNRVPRRCFSARCWTHGLSGRPPPLLVIWLFRWLGFRIMIGAGLIKLRGDPCWRDLTCLYYHYETQPIPNPISRYLHFAPHWFHKFGTAWNHFIELIVPWFSFGPRHSRHVAGALAGEFSSHPHHQRQSVVSELCHHHPVPGLFRRHFPSSRSSARDC